MQSISSIMVVNQPTCQPTKYKLKTDTFLWPSQRPLYRHNYTERWCSESPSVILAKTFTAWTFCIYLCQYIIMTKYKHIHILHFIVLQVHRTDYQHPQWRLEPSTYICICIRYTYANKCPSVLSPVLETLMFIRHHSLMKPRTTFFLHTVSQMIWSYFHRIY